MAIKQHARPNAERAYKSRTLSDLAGEAGAARLARFADKLDCGGSCWNWQAAAGAGGYGVFKLTSCRTVTAHRLALIAATGIDPPDLQAAHSCNNVLCCNPAHLRWATHQENQDDKNGRCSRRTSRHASRHRSVA